MDMTSFLHKLNAVNIPAIYTHQIIIQTPDSPKFMRNYATSKTLAIDGETVAR